MVDNTIITKKAASGESLMALAFKKNSPDFYICLHRGREWIVKIGFQQSHIEFNMQKYILMHHNHTFWVKIQQSNPGERFASHMAFQLFPW